MNHLKVPKYLVMADSDPFPATPNFADLENQAFGDIIDDVADKRDFPSMDLTLKTSESRKEGEERKVSKWGKVRSRFLPSRRKSRRKSRRVTQKIARKSTKVTISPPKISSQAAIATLGAKDDDTWTYVPSGSEGEENDDAASKKKTFNVKLYACIGVGVVILTALIWIGVLWFQKVSRDNAIAAKFLNDGEDRSNPEVWYQAAKRFQKDTLGGKYSLEYIPACVKAIELAGSKQKQAYHWLHAFTFFYVNQGRDNIMTGKGSGENDVLQSLYDALIFWTQKLPLDCDPWMYLAQILPAEDKPLYRDDPDHAKEAVEAIEKYKSLGGKESKYDELKPVALANRKRLCGY